MPAICGSAAPGRGAAREPLRSAYSTLFLCCSAIAWSIFIFRIFIGSSDGHAERDPFRATEKLVGGDRPHRLESPHRSGGAARARLFTEEAARLVSEQLRSRGV